MTAPTITSRAMFALEPDTLAGYLEQLEQLPGDADATFIATDGRTLTIVEDDTAEPLWAARARTLLRQ